MYALELKHGTTIESSIFPTLLSKHGFPEIIKPKPRRGMHRALARAGGLVAYAVAAGISQGMREFHAHSLESLE
jgi:hypothetical protein